MLFADYVVPLVMCAVFTDKIVHILTLRILYDIILAIYEFRVINSKFTLLYRRDIDYAIC